MRDYKISNAVIRRLPKYFRYLSELEANGIEVISSSKMSKGMNLNASQIRRDLNCFGGFGQQGYGYHVSRLRQEIMMIIGIGSPYNVVVFGAGNIGQALVKYRNFANEGYKIIAIFDVDESLIGKDIAGLIVKPMSEMPLFLKKNAIDIAIIAVPKQYAQELADGLVALGVKGIWNFAPIDVEARQGISVENVHLSDSLYVLSYKMKGKYDDNKSKNPPKV